MVFSFEFQPCHHEYLTIYTSHFFVIFPHAARTTVPGWFNYASGAAAAHPRLGAILVFAGGGALDLVFHTQ